jgi:hypothetical protein
VADDKHKSIKEKLTGECLEALQRILAEVALKSVASAELTAH